MPTGSRRQQLRPSQGPRTRQARRTNATGTENPGKVCGFLPFRSSRRPLGEALGVALGVALGAALAARHRTAPDPPPKMRPHLRRMLEETETENRSSPMGCASPKPHPVGYSAQHRREDASDEIGRLKAPPTNSNRKVDRPVLTHIDPPATCVAPPPRSGCTPNRVPAPHQATPGPLSPVTSAP